MRVVSRKKLPEFASLHADAGEWLDRWFYTANKAHWTSIEDVHEAYASADVVDKWTAFNIHANRYRLIIEINYMKQRVCVRHVLTCAEYNRGR